MISNQTCSCSFAKRLLLLSVVVIIVNDVLVSQTTPATAASTTATSSFSATGTAQSTSAGTTATSAVITPTTAVNTASTFEHIYYSQHQPVLEIVQQSCVDCDNANELVYDFKCKRFFYKGTWVRKPSDARAWYNHEFKVKVININRYLYNVGVSADNINYNSEQPTLFKELFLGEGKLM